MPQQVEFYLGYSSRRLSQVNSSPFETESEETDFESDFDDENWSVRPCYYQLAKSVSARSIRSFSSTSSIRKHQLSQTNHRNPCNCEIDDFLANDDCYNMQSKMEQVRLDNASNNKLPTAHYAAAPPPPVNIALPSPVEERNPAFGERLILPPPLPQHKAPTSPPLSPCAGVKSKFIENLTSSLPASYDNKQPLQPQKEQQHKSVSDITNMQQQHLADMKSSSSIVSSNYCCTTTSSSTLTNSTLHTDSAYISVYVPIAQAPRDNSLIEINLDPVSPLMLAATVADSSESLAGLEQQAIAELHLEDHHYIVDRFHQRPLLDDPEKPFIPASPVFPDIDQMFRETYPELDPNSEEYQYHKERLLRNRFKLRRLSQTFNDREELRRQRISLAKLHGFDHPRTKVKLF